MKVDLKKIKPVLFLLMLSFFSTNAQEVTVIAKLDTNSILIGDQVKFHLIVEHPIKTTIDFPLLADTLGEKIEIVEKQKIDTVVSATHSNLVERLTLTITSYDSGYFIIRPLAFIVNKDSSRKHETEALLLEVHTLSVDTTQAIKDIKGPLDTPFTLKEAIPYIIGGLLAILIILLVVYLVRKYKKKPVVVEEKVIIIPPHLVALNKLEELKQKKLWQQGLVKEYHSELSEIIRNYIELRFNLPALEQTSDEIVKSFRSVGIEEENKGKLKQLLFLADLVKFAKEQPVAAENELSFNNAFDFVNNTKPFEAIMNEEVKHV
jgi:hypothetical protein